MRITQRSMQMGVEANLHAALNRVQRLQEQLSSGKLISKPSDSPTGTVSALRLRAEIRRTEQLARNADDAAGWLNTADKALTSQLDIVNRARELLLQGINGSSDEKARQAIANEIEQLREAALDVANTTYLGRPVFAGTAATGQAYDAAGTYLGDAGTIERVISPSVSVQVNLTGPDVYGPAGQDLFTVLGDVAQHLVTDPTALQADLQNLDAAFDRIIGAVATLGARANQVEATKQRLEGVKIDSTSALAEVESIDLPATILQLELQSVAYQAALGAAARVIQPSLLDFLR